MVRIMAENKDMVSTGSDCFVRDIGTYNWDNISGTALIANDSNFFLRLADGGVIPLDDVTVSMAVANDGIVFESDEIGDAVIDLLIAKREFAIKCEQEEKISGMSLFPETRHVTKVDDLLTSNGTSGMVDDWFINAGNGAFYVSRSDISDDDKITRFAFIASCASRVLENGGSGKLAEIIAGLPQTKAKSSEKTVKATITINDNGDTLSIENNGKEYGYRIALASAEDKTIYAALNLTSETASELLDDLKVLERTR